MRPLLVVAPLLLAATLAYYIYVPLPDSIEEPWKLTLLDATFRTVMHVASFKAWLSGGDYMEVMQQTMMGESAGGEGLPGVKVSDVNFAGVPVRVYEPPAGGEGHLRRGLVYFHGGGWALASAKSPAYDAVGRRVSDELNAVVVSVEYRLYPKAIFPLPYLDCLAAAKHFLSPEVLERYAVDPERVGVSGDSAGGNLAAALAMEVATDDSVSVKFSVQALVYPVLQALDFNTPSYLQNQQIPCLYRPLMVRFWMQYLGAPLSLEPQYMLNNHSSLDQPNLTPELRSRVDWTVLLPKKHQEGYEPLIRERGLKGATKAVPQLLDVRASPLLAAAEVLAKCPRAYVLTCENDVLRDDGLMYVRRLRDAGVTVTSDHYEGGFHGCFTSTTWPFDFEVGRRSFRAYVDWLKDNL